MAAVWDQARFDAAYDMTGDGSRRFHYERTALFSVAQQKAQRIISIFGLTAAHRVVIFGCGFDWLGEALRAAGINAVGCDTSPYIQSAWGAGAETSSDKKPLNENGGNNGSRNKIKQEFAGNNDPTHVLSEDMISSLSDVELTDLAQWDSFTNAEIAHSTTAFFQQQQLDDNADLNWKTEADWRTFFNGIGLSHHRLFDPMWVREF